MAGFFSVRLAPGVRVSASSRGLRAHVGPRGARLHVGGGGTGVSTGTGPFTYYQSLSGGSRRSGSGRRARRRERTAVRTPARTVTTATVSAEERLTPKARRARDLATRIDLVESLHRQVFEPAVPRIAPVPDVPDRADVYAELEREHLRGTWFWQRSRRRELRRRAGEEADARHTELVEAADAAHRAEQQRIDERWVALTGNDPESVLAEVAASFEDNAAPAAPVGVERGELSLVVLVPGMDGIPERAPGTTAAGNLSIRKMTATRRWELYRQLVAGHALVSVREALAVAPGIRRVTVIVLRDEGPDVYGRPRAEPVLATRIDRASLEGVLWQEVTAWEVIEQLGHDTLLETRGRVDEVLPLDLTDEPDLRTLVNAVDLGELDVGRAGVGRAGARKQLGVDGRA